VGSGVLAVSEEKKWVSGGGGGGMHESLWFGREGIFVCAAR